MSILRCLSYTELVHPTQCLYSSVSHTLSYFTMCQSCSIKCVQALKNPNPLSLMEGLMCLLLQRCFWIGSGVDYLCKSTLDWIQSLSILKPFELKVFFKLSEKQLVVLSKQQIVLYLGVLRKVENYFWWLSCCQTKTTDWFEHSIDCLFSNHNRNMFCALTEL